MLVRWACATVGNIVRRQALNPHRLGAFAMPREVTVQTCTPPIRSTEITVTDVEEALTNVAACALPDDDKHERINTLLAVREHMLGRCTCCDA